MSVPSQAWPILTFGFLTSTSVLASPDSPTERANQALSTIKTTKPLKTEEFSQYGKVTGLMDPTGLHKGPSRPFRSPRGSGASLRKAAHRSYPHSSMSAKSSRIVGASKNRRLRLLSSDMGSPRVARSWRISSTVRRGGYQGGVHHSRAALAGANSSVPHRTGAGPNPSACGGTAP